MIHMKCQLIFSEKKKKKKKKMQNVCCSCDWQRFQILDDKSDVNPCPAAPGYTLPLQTV